MYKRQPVEFLLFNNVIIYNLYLYITLSGLQIKKIYVIMAFKRSDIPIVLLKALGNYHDHSNFYNFSHYLFPFINLCQVISYLIRSRERNDQFLILKRPKGFAKGLCCTSDIVCRYCSHPIIWILKHIMMAVSILYQVVCRVKKKSSLERVSKGQISGGVQCSALHN